MFETFENSKYFLRGHQTLYLLGFSFILRFSIKQFSKKILSLSKSFSFLWFLTFQSFGMLQHHHRVASLSALHLHLTAVKHPCCTVAPTTPSSHLPFPSKPHSLNPSHSRGGRHRTAQPANGVLSPSLACSPLPVYRAPAPGYINTTRAPLRITPVTSQILECFKNHKNLIFFK